MKNGLLRSTRGGNEISSEKGLAEKGLATVRAVLNNNKNKKKPQ